MAIPIKISMTLFTEIEKYSLKAHGITKTLNRQNNLEQKEQSWRASQHLTLKTYYKAM